MFSFSSKHTARLLLLIALYAATGTVFASTATTLPSAEVADTVSPDALPEDLATEESTLVPTLSVVPSDSTTATIIRRLYELTANAIFDRTQLGLYVYDLTTDAPIFAYGQHQQLRPASCEKLLTAITALRQLGTDYHYRTRLYLSGSVDADSTFRGTLCLRGGFDPLIDRYDLAAFADALRERGIVRLDRPVVFDRSFKDTTLYGWGWCWDDDTTPLTPLLYNKRATLPTHFLAALREAGIACSDTTLYAAVPASAELIAERTHTIDQVLLPMMKQSDNLLAESLFYQLASQTGQAYPSYKHAARQVGKLLTALSINADTYQIADGSGLSLYNYVTPHLLVAALRAAYHDDAVYRHLLPTLPIAGEDGTLRRRMTTGQARGNVRAKTGTLEGVSTLAGYCTAANGHVLCFAIMNQGIRYTSTGHRFQDRVCRALVGD